MSFPKIDVEQTFADFLAIYGAEISDRTLIGSNKPKNADYIFHKEKIIAELKLLKSNPFENRDFVKSLGKKQDEWLKKGLITPPALSQVTKIDQLPDKCYRDVEKLYTRSLKNHIDKTNKQIKHTKVRSNLLDYKGLLFLGSDGNQFLQPKHIRHILENLLGKDDFNSSINMVLYFTVNMVAVSSDDNIVSRLWVYFWRSENYEKISLSFLDDLFDNWTQYLSNLLKIPINKITEMNEEGVTERDILKNMKFT